MARKKRPITIYSILALVVLVAGGGATLAFSFLSIDNWIDEGDPYPIGRLNTMELPEGRVVFFFESPEIVPGNPDGVQIYIRRPDGEPLSSERIEDVPISEAESYGPRPFLPRRRVFGRPLWAVDVPASGVYEVRVTNNLEEQNMREDRIVVGKTPQSFAAMKKRNDQLKIAGLSITGAVFVLLYIMHGVSLSRREAREAVATAPASSA